MTDENTQNKDDAQDKIKKAKELFARYEAAAADEKKLDDQLAKLRTRKSDTVKEIEKLLGKGPFEWKGEELLITRRGENYYFRGKGRSNVTVIA